MLPVSYISHETHLYLQQRLQNVAHENNVRILFAIESGSRAWGFPSKDSDYDVRFVYAREKETYLSVKNFPDVIEIPSFYDNTLEVPLDLNGWDIRKALQLTIKSNPVLIEWLISPIKYIWDKAPVENLLDFTKKVVNMQAFKYHYYRLAVNSWEQIQQSKGNIKLKLYCYALRPVLSLQWIMHYNEIPPMDMPSLCNRLIKQEILQNAIFHLINLKATSNESDLITKNVALDHYIESILQNKVERPALAENVNPAFQDMADQIFRKIIGHIK